MAHLVGCCVCVCCVLCFVLQPKTRRLYLFFSGHNFFQFCNNWCSYFDATDGNLRFISTVGQMTVPFFFRVAFCSGCNLNPPKNMASQTTVPFFSGSIFFRSYVSTIIGARVKIQTQIRPKKITTRKKRYSRLAGYVFQTTRKNYVPKKKRYSRLTNG
jgi:hypothetical protein